MLSSVNFNNTTMSVGIDDNDDDVVGMLINDTEKDLVDLHKQFERLLRDVEKPLYFSCANNFTKLSAIIRLYNLKADNGWSDKSFLELLGLLVEMFPQLNKLPTSM